jgi:hypothetical protein
MAELSKEAQAVLDAYRSSHLSINNLAAALRAAAAIPSASAPVPFAHKLLAIADELEG